jgi:predicted N-acetyltransferase YhbS
MDEAGLRVDANICVTENEKGEIIIEHLWVRRELRGKGLGYQLLSLVVSKYQDRIIKAIVFPYAEKLYERLGFEKAGEEGSFSIYVRYPIVRR